MKSSSVSILRGIGFVSFFSLALPAFALEREPPPDDNAAPSYDGSAGYSRVMSNNYIPANEHVTGDVVAVMGNNRVDGYVSHDVVTVMGNAVINGTVAHNVVTTMGNVMLGSHAEVDGDIVCTGGNVNRAPGSIVKGRIVNGPFGGGHSTRRGFPGFVPRIPWSRYGWPSAPALPVVVSTLVIISIGLCTLLALVFPNGIRRCGDSLVERPGITILAAFVALLALPLIFILLCVTIVGIPVAIFFLPLGILAAVLFGNASVYGLVGRGLSRDRLHPALAVLIGGVLCGLFFFNPITGLLLSLALSVLGLGCVVTTLLTSKKSAAAAASPPQLVAQVPPPPAPAVIPEPAPSAAVPDSPPLAASSAPAAVSPLISSALPRAGFWIRMGALFIDVLIIGSVFGDGVINHRIIHEGFHISGSNLLLPLAIYGAIMWKLKGTTIGGMIFGLHVVRLDGREVEWETAIVRALSCFLSAILFLGFIWIAFDDEKQAWHDKIAGTVVVRAKGKSLL